MNARLTTVARILTIGAIAWGALAFGAVYPWAYWILVGIAISASVAAIVATGGSTPSLRAALLSVSPFVMAVGLQLVPIGTEGLTWVNPETVSALRQLDPVFALGLTTFHSLSLAPELTMTGLAIFLACAVLTVGVARLCREFGTSWLAGSLTALGALMAVIGITQKALFNGKIYGFWQPIAQSFLPFGPFVNRNHFAGWMMMALPVALGLLCARIDRGMVDVRPTWRDRVLWFGSPAASRLVLTGGAVALMALAQLLTFSRAGIGALVVVFGTMGLFVLTHAAGAARKSLGAIYLACIVALTFGWVGMDRIARRFEAGQVSDRFTAWADAKAITGRFPLTGVGFGAYGTSTLLYQNPALTGHYDQAHNDYLQLAAEGGVLLVVPAILLAGVIVTQIWVRFRDRGGSPASWWVRAGAVSGLIAIGLQEVVDFSLQMPGNALLCAVLIGIAIHRAPVPVVKRSS